MTLSTIIGAIELGLIFAIMSSGVFITFRVMDFPDLTVDGSFTLGCASGAILAYYGHPVIGVAVGFMAGVLAGLCTGFLHTKMKVQYILAGIITMTGLYSINLRVAGDKPNFSLFGKDTIYSLFETITNGMFGKFSDLVLLALVSGVILMLVVLFFKTPVGLALRATGDNEHMVRASSINTDRMKLLGLGLANGLVALAAAIYTQYQLFFDMDLGIGMMIVGLTGIIIGETIFGKKSILQSIIALTIGSVLYRLLLTYVLSMGMNPNDWKLLSAIFVAFVISLPTIQMYLSKKGK
ncbi:ABC transporter permease [Tannockella kyphosi]|uniref:ABC transporter permease n=1 Tax=Tannockella kyphosi TaxID=2899121 RepID=UPI0020136829|nr:ABC transporter permease [Tannockella kyphosi]